MVTRQPHTPLAKVLPVWCTGAVSTQIKAKVPFILLTGKPKSKGSISPHDLLFIPVNPPDTNVYWCPVKHIWKSFKDPQIASPPFRRTYIRAPPPYEVEAAGFQSRRAVLLPFWCKSKLVTQCYQVVKVAALFIMFSTVTGKLNQSLSEVQKRILKSCCI